MPLKLYNKKRDFTKTSEPAGETARRAGDARFVIQKHAASHLHYDFRLELDGVLKSWAVPKGPPFAHGEKRLAMEVEDHPVSYMKFEGIIPKGQYGGGTVMVWDIGTFKPLTASPLKDLAGGKLHFTLQGKKLAGEWYLVRTRRGEERNQWLLIKGGEGMKPVSKKADDASALSGKSMKQLAAGTQVWNSNRAYDGDSKDKKRKGLDNGNKATAKIPRGRTTAKARAKVVPESEEDEGEVRSLSKSAKRMKLPKPNSNLTKKPKAVKGKLLKFFEPMMAKLVKAPPAGQWEYEIKFDGYRALAFIGPDGIELLSRNDKDLSQKFPEVVESLRKLDTVNTVLDGEVVALGPKGHSSFQLLQALELGQEQPPLFYYVFDIPQYDGEDLRALPLPERRARLQRLLRGTNGSKGMKGNLRFSEAVGSDGAKLLVQARKLGLEGVIGKRADSVYETGRRSGAWIKLKTHREQEFVIGGYSDPEGGRKSFGALLVGVQDKGRKGGKEEAGKLLFTGKVGTGFNDALLRALKARFDKLERVTCPFANLPESSTGRYGSGVTRAEMKRCHWVRPTLVAQLKFAEWTRDGKLRQPVFLGLRADKDAADVVREEPAEA